MTLKLEKNIFDLDMQIPIGLQNIFIVDDDDISTFVTRKCIENSGYSGKIISERDTENALNDLLKYSISSQNKQIPTLIFLDVQMPHMNGIEFLSELRKINFHNESERPRVVLLSSSIEDLDRARARGFNDVVEYVEKPLHVNSFNNIIRNYFSAVA